MRLYFCARLSSIVRYFSFQVMTGRPLIDLDGNFVGMNFNSEDKDSSPLLPRNIIFDCLLHSGTLWYVFYTFI
uniref:Uncharacterized protein n=1 Tax=Arundo donax TaxID=35708 RepID=A0A0A9HSR2_ARUDO